MPIAQIKEIEGLEERTDLIRAGLKGHGGALIPMIIASGQITNDLSLSNFRSLTLTANATLNLPENEEEGAYSQIVFCKQNEDGDHTLSFASGYEVYGDDIPTLANSKFMLNILYDGAGVRNVIVTNTP